MGYQNLALMEEGATTPIDDITIDHVTETNYYEKLRAADINWIEDDNGEKIAFYYNKEVTVQDGDEAIANNSKVIVYPVLDPTSTQDNKKIIIKSAPASSDQTTGVTTSSGASVYTQERDAYTINAFKAAGVNIDAVQNPEIINQVWDKVKENEESGGLFHYDGKDYLMGNLRRQETNDGLGFKFWHEEQNIANLYKAGAALGMFSANDFVEDDPETRDYMRYTAQVGDRVTLKAPNDRDGSAYDEDWLQAFIRPMMYALATNTDCLIPSDSEWENNFYAFGITPTTAISVYLDNQVMTNVNKHINIWASFFHNQYYTGNSGLTGLWGCYLPETGNAEIDENYPDRGYARVHIATTYYHYNRKWNRAVQSPGVFAGGGNDAQYNEFILVYCQDDFLNYLDLISENAGGGTAGKQAQALFLNNLPLFIFANCEAYHEDLPGITRDPDVLEVPRDADTTTIINQMQTQYPDWYDYSYTLNVYDNDTNVTNPVKYLPIGTGTQPKIDFPDPADIINNYATYKGLETPTNSVLPAEDPPTPTAGSSKFWTIYNPSDAQMDQLGGQMWQQNVIEILKQTFVNPTDGIISWHQIFLPPTISQTTQHIKLGDYDTGISAYKVTNTVIHKLFGTIQIPKYFNDYRDYTETTVSLFLPFIGFVEIDARDVIGGWLTCTYRIDVITGTCIATLSPTKGGPNGNVSECSYQFTGNCAVQLPITQADRSRLLSGILSGAGNGAALGAKGGGLIGGGVGAGVGGAIGAVAGGALGGVSGYFGGVIKSNGFSANAGALSIYKTPFAIVNRNKPADPDNYNKYYGDPAAKEVKLSSLSGYVRVKSVYVDIPRATDAEKAMIASILKQGVILP